MTHAQNKYLSEFDAPCVTATSKTWTPPRRTPGLPRRALTLPTYSGFEAYARQVGERLVSIARENPYRPLASRTADERFDAFMTQCFYTCGLGLHADLYCSGSFRDELDKRIAREIVDRVSALAPTAQLRPASDRGVVLMQIALMDSLRYAREQFFSEQTVLDAIAEEVTEAA